MASESDPANAIEALQRQIAELQAQLAKQQASSIATQGGSVVHGSVAAGSHFIGRDFIQIVKQVTQRGDDPDEVSEVIAHYLAALVGDLAGLKLGEIDVAASETRREPLRLADVYVPLHTHLRIPAGTTLAQWLARDRPSERSERARIEVQRRTRPVPARAALAQHRKLTLLGSGKSTFGASVLLALRRSCAIATPRQTRRFVDS